MRRLALVLVASIVSGAFAQSRPESAASRPISKVSVRRLPFPVESNAIVPASCSFSQDGRFLAVATGLPEIHDFQSTRMSKAPMGNPNWPPAFSPRSDRVAVTVDRGVALLKFEAGEWRHEKTIALPFQPRVVFPCPRTMSWSPDGKNLMIAERTADSRSPSILEPETGTVRVLDCGSALVWSGLIVDDRRSVVTCKTAAGWDTLVFDDGRQVETWRGLAILAASADGRSWLIERKDPGARPVDARVSSAAEEALRTHVEILDAKTLARLGRVNDLVSMAAFSGDGRVLVTSDREIKNVDIRHGRTGEILQTIRYYEGDRVVAFAISPDGRRLLTMGRPGRERARDGVVLWELAFE